MSLSSEFHSLRNVQEWLKRMRDECASVAFAHAKATPPTWTGRASTAFDEYRHRARMRWLDVSDAFDVAHDAVETYLYTQVEVTRLLQGSEDRGRLWQQLADEERLAVTAVDKAAEELWHVRSELPEPVVAAAPPNAPPAPQRKLSRAEDFMARPHVEFVVTTAAIAARYPRWLRQGLSRA